MGIRTFGIFAHVDAGKTTLTESLLYLSGAVKKLGRVDQGTAHTDRMDVEKQRGISVQSCPVVFEYEKNQYYLIDTPGHLDFTSQVETALQVIDGAVIIISAVDGIRPHTQIIMDQVKKYQIPTVLFINKVDRVGASHESIMQELKKMFSPAVCLMQEIDGEQTTGFTLHSRVGQGDFLECVTEILCDLDQDLMELYVNEQSLDPDKLLNSFYLYANTGQVYPTYMGSALHGKGIKELLEGIKYSFPDSTGLKEKPLSAVVFKIENHPSFGRMAYTRIYEGQLKVKNEILSVKDEKIVKANQIKLFTGERFVDTNQLSAGEIGAVIGLEGIQAKDMLGLENSRHRKELSTGVPVMRVKTMPVDPSKTGEFLSALQCLNDEDPSLNLTWIPEKKEFHIELFGTIQIEVLKNVLQERFGLEAFFEDPAVLYMETPVTEGEGFVSYTMPKPCWAVIKLCMKPGAPGSGVKFHSTVNHDVILYRYQKQIKEALPVALSQGLYGWKVTDIDITLIDGEYHVVHTKAPDFTVATPMAIMDGLKNTGTYLLEPILSFDLKGPEYVIGSVIKKLTDMRCVFDSPVIDNSQFFITGEMPVATSLQFPVEFSILTHGKGVLSTRFFRYKTCPPELGSTCERRGVNPLDRAKYILSVRNAL